MNKQVKNKVIQSTEDLPSGFALWTGVKNEFELSDEEKNQFAVLGRMGSKSCLFLEVENLRNESVKFHLIKKLKNSGYTIEHILTLTETVLKLVYEDDRLMHATTVSDQKGDSKVTDFFDEIVGDALQNEVSDIHIEKRANKAVVKMRKHGEMMDYKELTAGQAHDLCSVIYNVLAENKDVMFTPSDYQSAAVNRVVNGIEVKLRYQSLPVYPDGFDVVLRVLPIGKNEDYIPLDKLGYTPSQVSELMKIVSKPVGMLVIAGTTGSGKSTTLKNLLMYIHEEREYRDKIYTVEDPPEYKIPRVSQVPVIRRKKENSGDVKSPFDDPLTAVMRADPDIIMIGEVRDRETGSALKKAVQSGHQVLTTVHAASALAIVDRFVDFGLTHSVLGSPEFISGLCYQKLVALICPDCSVKFEDHIKIKNKQSDNELYERLTLVCDFERDDIRVRGPGCPSCDGVGVIGRTVCAEIVMPDTELLDSFNRGESAYAKQKWIKMSDGDPYSTNMIGKSAMEHAMLKLRKGMVSPHDVEAAFGLISPDVVLSSVNSLINKE